MSLRRAVFLDRDGVINEDRDDYVKNVGELAVYPEAPGAISRLAAAGFEVIVVSNQQGVAKGIIAEDDLLAIQAEISRQVEAAGGAISAFYYCKHLASEGCSCRKPQPGMLLQAASERCIDLAHSFMIGDTSKDMMAGKSAGCATVLVTTGNVTRNDVRNLPCQPDYVADDIAGAAEYVLSRDLPNAKPSPPVQTPGRGPRR